MALPAFAAERRAKPPLLLGTRRPPRLSIDIACPPGPQQQTHCSQVRRPWDGGYRLPAGPTAANPLQPSAAAE